MVKDKIFRTDGALSINYPYYIKRDIDQTINDFLYEDKVILYIAGPRHFGKTSLLYRIREQLLKNNWIVCYIDLAALKNLPASHQTRQNNLTNAFARLP